MALDVSNLHVFLCSQRQTVITGGSSCCILSHFALRAWTCSRTHVNTKPFETRQDRYAPWTLWARSTVSSWQNEFAPEETQATSVYSYSSVLMASITYVSQPKLLCSAHNGHVSERHHGREPVLPGPRDWKEHLDWLGAGLTESRYRRPWLYLAVELTLQPLSAPSKLSVAWQWTSHAPLRGEAAITDKPRDFRGIFVCKITYDMPH